MSNVVQFGDYKPVADPITARDRLDTYRAELDHLSRHLTTLTRDFEPIQLAVRKHCDTHELGLYQRSIDEDAFKLPAEKLREKLAMRDLDAALYGAFVAHEAAIERTKRRIGDLKVLVEAQRSVLSALKMEMEAAA